MSEVKAEVGTLIIPTYPEPAAEEMPMFAENRVHQRTSGRPYPNKVVMEVNRRQKVDREYTVVTLENEYVKIEILPEIGGRIYSALDKTTGYDYFYKQHVIKPALIGVLGSWISGGVEFNWPFHHRASGFMPCDFKLEKLPDGGAACHLSEHDPIDRMKGMVSVILRPGQSSFETKMRLYNRTSAEKSFLWWENAAVPVNESYQIFFPADVSYVNFHYLKSRTTYPIAGNGVFNGIPMETDRDISWHKNTRQATSYFACASDYDFFGGYDHGKQCGVVHIGDHHISPGKKMFTWAYCQLSESWEKALTDTDGAYAELMAGSYSDNQPNFSWLAPYETKEFSQHWYPISKLGTPTFANLNCAFRLDREKHTLAIQSTKVYPKAEICVKDGDRVRFQTVCTLTPEQAVTFAVTEDLPAYVTVCITAAGETVACYREKNFDRFNMPDVITDMPLAADMNDPDELYLAGVHVDQYRDPHTNPDSYWKEALKRKINHIPSLIAMAKYELNRYALSSAERYAARAVEALSIYNTHPQSGEVYYTCGRIAEAKGEFDRAYDFYYQAFWAADCVAKAMTRIAVLDLRRQNYSEAIRHAETALDYGGKNNLAVVCLHLALKETGKTEEAAQVLSRHLAKDSLDHLARYCSGETDFYAGLSSDPVQTCLDMAFDLSAMGRVRDALNLLEKLEESRPDCRRKPLYYTIGYLKGLLGQDVSPDYQKAETVELGPCYPVRLEEIAVLNSVIAATGSAEAKMLLGCLYYNKMHYKTAAALWEESAEHSTVAKRNLAVAYFSHLNRPEEAVRMMKELVNACPEDAQLLYETVVLMDKTGEPAEDKIRLMTAHPVTRDDILTELAKAYNQALQPEKAVETLMSHTFVPCEGGEHAIADQYMLAYLMMGKTELDRGNTKEALALFRKGQVLPQSLGSGIWNHCKLIPLKFHEAVCLEALAETQEAHKIFRYIAGVEIEYFSNMHLKELPYWQANALVHLGEQTKAQHLITKYMREWDRIAQGKDNGYFGTTPFFISFVDCPSRLRKAQHRYLMALTHSFVGKRETAAQELSESVALNKENHFARFFKTFGFLEK